MDYFVPSPQELLVLVVERGPLVLPFVVATTLVASYWAWRRRRAALRYGAGGLLILATLAGIGALVFSYAVRSELRRHTVELELRTLDDGRLHHVSDWSADILVVNYWATWCALCRRELPELARLAEEYQSRDVVVLTLTSEDPAIVREQGPAALEKTVNATFVVATRPSGLAGVVLQWRPVTLILDRQGKVGRFLLGAQTYASLERAVRELA